MVYLLTRSISHQSRPSLLSMDRSDDNPSLRDLVSSDPEPHPCQASHPYLWARMGPDVADRPLSPRLECCRDLVLQDHNPPDLPVTGQSVRAVSSGQHGGRAAVYVALPGLVSGQSMQAQLRKATLNGTPSSAGEARDISSAERAVWVFVAMHLSRVLVCLKGPSNSSPVVL